ncbi:MAG: hypothetical protein NTX95_04390 [Actinobacteria bacterium]|nr:hypothetical protein [Actinomycetota bacterium]
MPLIRVAGAAVIAVLLFTGLAQAAPTLVEPPTIAGQPHVGERLAVLAAQVDEATSDDMTITWERSDGNRFTEITDAHESVYVPTVVDLGHRLRVHVVVETATGRDEGWSEPTAAVAYGPARVTQVVRVGATPGAPASLDRWTVVAGASARLIGRLAPEFATADLRLVLEPTVPTYATVEAPVSIDETGRIAADVTPTVNAHVWLEVALQGEAAQRIALGLVGVRPRIYVVLGAQPDGRDGGGRRLIRDLRILSGSVIAPGVAGLRLSWEGKLPGDRTGTSVCRFGERVTSRVNGRLRGSCRTRGAWAAARWRLVLDPGTANPAAAPFLPAASAWIVPRLGGVVAAPPQVPNLPRSSATLPPWI